MARFNPTPKEISTIEQIETAVTDPTLLEHHRSEMMRRLWSQLEAMHGSKVISLISPEGQVIRSPFVEN